MSQRQPLTRLSQRNALHACPHPECSRQVPSLIWACSEHWQALPPQIRQGIWNASRGAGPGSLALDTAEQQAFAYWGAIERELRELTTEAAPHAPAGTPQTIA